MSYPIHPNRKRCPLCAGDIFIETEGRESLIYCETCTANFEPIKWADGPDETHEVEFLNFEEQSTAAQVMREELQS